MAPKSKPKKVAKRKTTDLKNFKSLAKAAMKETPIGPAESYRHYERRMSAKYPEVIAAVQNRGLTMAEKVAVWDPNPRYKWSRAGYTPGYPGKPGGGKSKSQKRKKG